MKILLYACIPVKPLCLLEMKHNPLMNFILAVPHWLLEHSTKVPLVYSSWKGWGLTIITVRCIGERCKVKYSSSCRLWKGKSEKGNFCSGSESCLVFVVVFYSPDWKQTIAVSDLEQKKKKKGNMLMDIKTNEFHSWNGGSQQEVDWKHSMISFISSYFWQL